MPAEEHLQYVPESGAIPLRVAVSGAIAAIVLLALAIGGLAAIYQRGVPVKTVPAPQAFPAPQVVPRSDDIAQLHRLNAEQSQRLNSWGWADAKHTLVQVPIARAMQLLMQKGDAAWAPLEPPQPALTSPTAGAERAITLDGVSPGSAAPPTGPARSSQNATPPQEKPQ